MPELSIIRAYPVSPKTISPVRLLKALPSLLPTIAPTILPLLSIGLANMMTSWFVTLLTSGSPTLVSPSKALIR